MRIISSFIYQFDKITKALNILSVLFLVISVTITFANVVMRYVLKCPIFWADELATLSLIAMVFLPIAVVEKTGDHLRVNILFQLLGQKMRIFGEYLRLLGTIIIGIYITVPGFALVYQNYQFSIKTIALKIPTSLTLAVIPIAFFAITIVCLLRFLTLLFNNNFEKFSKAN